MGTSRPTPGKTLWQISVSISPEAEEPVGALLERIFGRPASIQVKVLTGAVSANTFSSTRFAENIEQLKKGLKELKADGLEVGSGKISVKRLKHENWAESWKKHFPPLVIGKALLVKPEWSKRKARAGQSVIVLNPGLSFGTGQHPTTRFCLEELVRWRKEGSAQSCLDIGCGSGILAIAAVKLGYKPVLGVDFDPLAVRIAKANARKNKVRIQIKQQDITADAGGKLGRHDAVCANLTYDLLIQEQKKILGQLKQGGVLILAGILETQFSAVRTVYQEAGYKVVRTEREKEWRSGTFIKER